LESDEIDQVPTIERGFEPFQVNSFGENIAVNLGMIFVSITALILCMLLLPHFLIFWSE
jgi:hypothetical protein